MGTFPTYLNDTRLLAEVINPKFPFVRVDGHGTLHAHLDCKWLSDHPGSSLPTLVTLDLREISPAALCQFCMGDHLVDVIRDWGNPVGLSGRAFYGVCSGPLLPDSGQHREMGRLMLERIAARFQVKTLWRGAARGMKGDRLSWHIVVLPDTLANWIDQYFPHRSEILLGIAGAVEDGDTDALIECAVGLWEQSQDGPLGTLGTALEAARAICFEPS